MAWSTIFALKVDTSTPAQSVSNINWIDLTTPTIIGFIASQSTIEFWKPPQDSWESCYGNHSQQSSKNQQRSKNCTSCSHSWSSTEALVTTTTKTNSHFDIPCTLSDSLWHFARLTPCGGTFLGQKLIAMSTKLFAASTDVAKTAPNAYKIPAYNTSSW